MTENDFAFLWLVCDHGWDGAVRIWVNLRDHWDEWKVWLRRQEEI